MKPEYLQSIKRFLIRSLFLLFVFNLAGADIFAQQSLTLSGTVSETTAGRPVSFAQIIVLEARVKTRTDTGGRFTIEIPQPGNYTVIIQSPGLQRYQKQVQISSSQSRNFHLSPLRVQGSAIEVHGQRDIQKIARYTMTVKELKEVPGSFGDSISALASLPGIIRTNGFVGPLIIRGVMPEFNRYYLDDMPIIHPQHFFGLHSVVNNDMMSEIDLFSSAYSAEVPGGAGPVIRINTIDEVKEFGGNGEVNLLSSNALLKAPLGYGLPSQGLKTIPPEKGARTGYWVVAGRVSYYSVVLPPLLKALTGERLEQLPEYYDYQAKGKYYLNSDNAITILLLGTSDKIKFLNEPAATDRQKAIDDGADPLALDVKFEQDLISNNAGVTYTWQPSEKIYNRLTIFASLTESYFHVSLKETAWLDDLSSRAHPNIYGLKETFYISLFDELLKLKTGAELLYHEFSFESASIIPTQPIIGQPDLADASLFQKTRTTGNFYNTQYGFFLVPRFSFAGLQIEPGIRSDYLTKTEARTVDPRGRISYDFDIGTTISVAGGRYSTFAQTNPSFFSGNPEVGGADAHVKPWRSIHKAVGVEQKIGNEWSIKLEGYQINTYDLMSWSPHCVDSSEVQTSSTPSSDFTCPSGESWRAGYPGQESRSQGIEMIIKKDRNEGKDDWFGWLSYSYGTASSKNAYPESIAGTSYNKFITSLYEREHSLKLVGGYTWDGHTLSGKFQYFSKLPYTPIIGSEESPAGSGRYVPVYAGITSGEENSANYGADHRLDLRYSYRDNHEWGYITWYVEVLNVYNYKPKTSQNWKYNKPYQPGVNPSFEADPMSIIIPNFGVEVKF